MEKSHRDTGLPLATYDFSHNIKPVNQSVSCCSSNKLNTVTNCPDTASLHKFPYLNRSASLDECTSNDVVMQDNSASVQSNTPQLISSVGLSVLRPTLNSNAIPDLLEINENITVLGTVLLRIQSPSGELVGPVRAMCDSGSQVN